MADPAFPKYQLHNESLITFLQEVSYKRKKYVFTDSKIISFTNMFHTHSEQLQNSPSYSIHF